MPDLAGQKIAYFGFTGPIEPNGATRIAAAFNQAVNNNYDEVHLAFSSNGGYVADGIYLYNHIRAMPFTTVAYNIGSCSSIAVPVFLAADKRYCSPHAMFMIHPTSFPGSPDAGMSAEQLQSTLNSALADDTRTENILRERCSLPDELLGARRFRDVHLRPEDAHKYGLVHDLRDLSIPDGSQIIQI